jgi:hypothetical protein
MRRRAFVAGSIAVLATPRAVPAQPPSKPVGIGRLSPLSAASEAPSGPPGRWA